jgi:hypothetical protein
MTAEIIGRSVVEKGQSGQGRKLARDKVKKIGPEVYKKHL